MGSRSLEDYPMLWRNGKMVQMSYRVDSLQGAVEMWMSEVQGCEDFYIDISIMRLEKDILARHDIPCGIWDIYPRPPVLWTLIWCHYVCNILELPDPCNVQCEDVQIVPKSLFDAIEEHFDDEPKPPFWDAIPDVTDIQEYDDEESFSSSTVHGIV
jgi:hypothetical protein